MDRQLKNKSKEEDAFLIKLIAFYKKSLGEASSTVRCLKEIQDTFPNEYKDLIELQEDPSCLIEFANKMDSEGSRILIELFVKASTLSNRMNKLFGSTVDEKEKLAKDLEIFSQDMENNIQQLKEKSKALPYNKANKDV